MNIPVRTKYNRSRVWHTISNETVISLPIKAAPVPKSAEICPNAITVPNVIVLASIPVRIISKSLYHGTCDGV